MLPELAEQVKSAVMQLEVTTNSTSARGESWRCGSAFFVDPRHALTYWSLIDDSQASLLLMGNCGVNRQATLVSTNPGSNLALLRLDDGEPDALTWLDLAEGLPEEPSQIRLFGWRRYQGDVWASKSWPGSLSPKPTHCDCPYPDCPYRAEKRGWLEATMMMKTCWGWGGGPIVDFSGQVVSLGIEITERIQVRRRSRGSGSPPTRELRALLLGANLVSMQELLTSRPAQS